MSGMEAVDKRKVLRQRSIDKEKEKAEKRRSLTDSVKKILKKDVENRTDDDKEFLEQNKTIAKKITKNITSREEKEDRKKEWEDDLDVLKAKCLKLAEAIKKSKRLVVYTGAGTSTSANIPDYRGPNGIWTLLDQGKEIAACDLGLAQPTTAHMALFMLYKQGKISHIVSQNCDGLHLRSGIPRCKISEVHGNMFIEVCKACKPVRPYVRLFDVTERTNRHRHTTMRRCYICGNSLQDTIVHFGERGSIAWPINWNGASKAAEKADMILCLGSSLKVLRRYPWLWCMDRPSNKRPPLYIVNLQWTPKDHAATLKINGRCDFVLAEVLKALKMKIPEYTPYNDPLLSFATHLHEKEEHTTSRKTLIESKPVGVTQLSMTADVSPNGVITEVRVKNKFTTAKTEFQHMSSERAAESTDTETEQDEKNTDGEEEAEVKQEIGENGDGESIHIKSEAEEGDMEVSNDLEAEAVMTNGTHPESNTQDSVPENGDTTDPSIINDKVTSDPGDNNNQVPPHHNGDHRQDPDHGVSKHSHGLEAVSDGPKDEAVTASNKKPKLESLNNISDPKGREYLFLAHHFLILFHKGDKNLLHSIMSQIDSVYSRPFPSPDHTYAISPVKEEALEPATSNGIKTETLEQPEEEQTPTYRGRVSGDKCISSFSVISIVECLQNIIDNWFHVSVATKKESKVQSNRRRLFPNVPRRAS